MAEQMYSVVSSTELESLRGQLRGRMILPMDDGYDEARRVWNGMIDRRPAAIVRCSGTADVMAAVNFARDHRLPVSVRGGGHNVSGNAVCDDGVVIDFSTMRGIRVDPQSRRVRVQAGARLGDIDHETTPFELALPQGVVSETGIAGLALHGGMGFLTRKYGLTADHLLSADVVTAEGKLIQVDEKNHPDLLWALKGGGGNFGVVTSFEFRLQPVTPQVWIALTIYPIEAARWVMSVFREIMMEAPDELMGIAIYWNAPMHEPIPIEYRGTPVVILAGCWSGPFEQGEEAIRPLREVASPIADLSGPMPFLEAQRLFDPEYPSGRHYYWKSTFLSDMPVEAVDMLTDYASRRPSGISSIDVWAMGGAMNRVQPGATAFHDRYSPFLLGIEANWDEPGMDEANVTWVRDLIADAQAFSPGGAYYNFPGFLEEGDDLLRKSYGANYQRLRQVKTRYDPNNLFQYNLRIPVNAH